MQPVKERRHHFDGVHTRRSRNLHDDQYDADSLANVFEGHAQRVNDIHVDKRDAHARKDKQHRMQALNTNDQVAHADDNRLHDSQKHHQQPAAKIALFCRVGANALAVDLEFEDGDKHVAAHPQGEVGVERRDARAKTRHGIHHLALDLHRRGHEVGDVVDIDVKQVGKLARYLGAVKRRDVICGHIELLLNRRQLITRVGERSLRLVEQGRKLGERRARLRNSGSKRSQDALKVPRAIRERIEARIELRNHAGIEVFLHLSQRRHAILYTRIDGIRGVGKIAGIRLDGVALRLKAAHNAGQIVVLLLQRRDNPRDRAIELGIVGQRAAQCLDGGIVLIHETLNIREGKVDLGLGSDHRARELTHGSVRL